MKAWFKAHKGQIILNLITILIIGSMLTIYGVKAASQRQALPGGFNPGVFSYQGYLSDKNGQPLTGEYPRHNIMGRVPGRPQPGSSDRWSGQFNAGKHHPHT